MKYGLTLRSLVGLACALVVLFGTHRATGWELSYEKYHAGHLNEAISLDESQSKTALKKNLLLPFNRTRVPGTEGSREIQRFIVEHFNTTLAGEWAVETQPFEENGYHFNNLVMTLQNNASEYLVLAAHYDTKIAPTGMVGAIDSAASCAALLYAAQFLTHIARDERAMEGHSLESDPVVVGSRLGVKIVFFDGEEAIDEWGPEDSIYGARRLAAQWLADGTMAQVRLLFLMDLLGSGEEEPMVPSFYADSHQHYQLLNRIEDDLLFRRSDGSGTEPSLLAAQVALQRKRLDPTDYRFLGLGRSVVGDDHTPFLDAGVHVLHAIPLPFPTTWHTIRDDFQHLDAAETRYWALLVCEFVVQSLIGRV